MNIAVLGAGYVGLVTSSTLAYLGHKVVNIETDEVKLEYLMKGTVPFYEPNLENLVRIVVNNGNLSFTGKASDAIKAAQVIFITVGTPSGIDGQPDLSQLLNAARSIGQALDSTQHRIIINKSTVPVGSGNWVEMLISQSIQQIQLTPARSQKINPISFSVVSNPEFLREGTALIDSFYPDRIVVGVSDDTSSSVIRKLYEPILSQSFDQPLNILRPKHLKAVPLIEVDIASAELIKYASNSFLAMKISFANEIANISEKVGANINHVMDAIGLDSRIGRSFLNAGIGWGGSCFKKDVSALINIASEYDLALNLLPATVKVNEAQRLIVIRKLQEELKIIKGRKIGIMGLAFKPNTDDLRDAPSISIITQLLKMGSSVKVFDPVAHDALKQQRPDLDVIFANNIEDLSRDTDALILVTEWSEFILAKYENIKKLVRNPLIIDGRNCLNKEHLIELGFNYKGIGL